eukprot:GFUD01010908.1.p1 GENE.GFUD01010908.1~~GFUD01010908.1.p1  ORF type:complete len:163 (-),score=68.58 GFUD01010908.1:63-551(-)
MASKITLGDEDVSRIRAQFQTLDLNGDGTITVTEMRKALSDAGQDYTMKDVQRMVKKADKNGDGQVAWEEFLEMMAEHLGREGVKYVEGKEATPDEYDQAMQAFKMFDKNSDGMIDVHELKEAMKDLQLEQDPAKVEQLFKDLDKDGNGSIDYVEFGRLLGI